MSGTKTYRVNVSVLVQSDTNENAVKTVIQPLIKAGLDVRLKIAILTNVEPQNG